jgi:uncharacterized membrane protein
MFSTWMVSTAVPHDVSDPLMPAVAVLVIEMCVTCFSEAAERRQWVEVAHGGHVSGPSGSVALNRNHSLQYYAVRLQHVVSNRH